jgi:hypothetical protein
MVIPLAITAKRSDGSPWRRNCRERSISERRCAPSPAPGSHDSPAKHNPAASMSPRLRDRPARAAQPPGGAPPARPGSSSSSTAGPSPMPSPRSLDGGPTARPNPPSGRLRAQAHSTARSGPMSRPTPEPLDQRPALRRAVRNSSSGRRSAGGRSLRQGRQGDTMNAIAPDAAALRSRHVARRTGCGRLGRYSGLLPSQ